jgi:hypothetical protein
LGGWGGEIESDRKLRRGREEKKASRSVGLVKLNKVGKASGDGGMTVDKPRHRCEYESCNSREPLNEGDDNFYIDRHERCADLCNMRGRVERGDDLKVGSRELCAERNVELDPCDRHQIPYGKMSNNVYTKSVCYPNTKQSFLSYLPPRDSRLTSGAA